MLHSIVRYLASMAPDGMHLSGCGLVLLDSTNVKDDWTWLILKVRSRHRAVWQIALRIYNHYWKMVKSGITRIRKDELKSGDILPNLIRALRSFVCFKSRIDPSHFSNLINC